MSRSTYGGGQSVPASTLVKGDTIRDPRKKDRILVVCSVGSQIFARGYEQVDIEHHHWIDKGESVIKVSGASTSTTVEPKDEESL